MQAQFGEKRPQRFRVKLRYCFSQRTDLSWGEVKPLFMKLHATDRRHRVSHWQDMLAYVTICEDEEVGLSSKQRFNQKKRKFEEVNAEML